MVGTAQAKPKWAPISPADLAATSSKDFPEADLEILFFHQAINGNRIDTWTSNHIQAKIYSAKGIERMSIFRIEHDKNFRAGALAGRVVKPDGTSVELTKNDFHETVAVKTGGVEILRTTFAFPNVQPGDVVEYSWTQGLATHYGHYQRFYCQSEAPTREYVFNLLGASADVNVMWFNCTPAERKSKQVVFRNLPAFVPEPYMPVETGFRGWIMVLIDHPFLRHYAKDDSWKLIGEYLAEEFRLGTVPTKPMRAKAEELTAGLATPEEKLARLYHYTQETVTNLSWFHTADTVAAKKKRIQEEGDQTAAKTFERQTGLANDVDRLFAGLVRAIGFEVRLALNADREKMLEIKNSRGWIFADRLSVAVKLSDHWKFYTPGQYLVPPGMLRTNDEGATVYVCDEKKGWFETAPIGLPEHSQLRRTGRFTLDAEGSLEGEVTLFMTGQHAMRAKDNWWDFSDEDLTSRIRDDLAKRLPTAEVSEVRSENRRNRTQPFILHYKVQVPAYAETIGSRLAFSPNFFEANSAEIFTSETRRFPIFFDFAEQEHDEIELQLPEGFVLDGASAPASVSSAADVVHAYYNVKYMPGKRRLAYRRDFTLGTGGVIHFRPESYAPLRRLLSRVHASDTHQLVLKRKAAATSAPSDAPDSERSTQP